MLRRIALGTTTMLALLGACVLAGCARHAPARASVTVRWLAGRSEPAFDPCGPAEPLRRAMEDLLSYGLLRADSTGAVQPLAAESFAWSDAGRTLTLRLRPDLRFTDGSAATSDDFRVALLAGLARSDHATLGWLLAGVTGVERVRPGRLLPAIGIECPDPRTLVVRLARADSTLPARLACPGVGVPWRGGATWGSAVGLGPYRVATEEPGRAVTFVRAAPAGARGASADSVALRFAIGAPRVRLVLRRLSADVVWPLPPSLLDETLPPGWTLAERNATPARRLLLVFRCDVPPTTKLAARAALAHALNHEELAAALRRAGTKPAAWLDGAPPFEFPRLDAAESRQWLARGDLGASFHVVLAYDADGAGAEVARALQGQWAALGLYAELRPLRGAEALAAPLAASAAQVQLVEAQAVLPGAAAQLAGLVMPLRGPAVGTFRTGWRTRDYDRWIATPVAADSLDAGAAQARLEDELIALPLATLPGRWLTRDGGPGEAGNPAEGPHFATIGPAAASPVTSGSGSR